jgi:mRNA-degrading endonuclease RelE of RelBE toxin-antitoxin system
LAWNVEFEEQAVKQLRMLGHDAERRVRGFLRERVAPSENPRVLGIALQGKRFAGLRRYRVGDDRVILQDRGPATGRGGCIRRQPEGSLSLMPDLTVTEAIDNVYTSLREDNRDLDAHIAALKGALVREGRREAVFDPGKLAQNNRQGRKLMQAYFRQRGVAVTFSG